MKVVVVLPILPFLFDEFLELLQAFFVTADFNNFLLRRDRVVGVVYISSRPNLQPHYPEPCQYKH